MVDRRRVGAAVGLGVLVLAVVVAGLVGFRRTPADLADRPARVAQPAAVGPHAGTWTKVAAPPLAPRWGAVGAGSGQVVYVVGGSGRPPCGNRRCPHDRGRRDGAVYDVSQAVWTRLPAAPVPVPPGSAAVVVADQLVVRAGATWLLYLPGNGWTRLPAPSLDATALDSVDGYRAYALDARTGAVAVLDLATGRWRSLPRPPGPAPRRPTLVAYEGGVAVAGAAPGARGQASGRTVVDRWDGQQGLDGLGRRAVWRRSMEQGRGRVDPHSGDWLDLPAPPARGVPDSVALDPGAGRPATSGTGYVWDPVARAWVGLGRPPSAAYALRTVAYAGTAVYLIGGYDAYVGAREPGGLTRDAWVWTP